MLLIDWILCAALTLGIAFWWMTGVQARRRIVVVASLVALVVGVVAVMDHRWQAAGGVTVALLLLVATWLGKRREGRKPLRVPYVSGSLFTVLGVIAFGLLYVFVIIRLPAPSGEHPVGVKDFELTDDSRMGVLAAEADEPRRLLVRVWYPAGDVAGLSPRPYFNDVEAETTASGLGSTMGMPFFFQYLKHSSTNSYENAPLMDAAANRPVVIYSHGYTSFPGQNTALLEELASHGYIVYSVQHTYDSSPVVFPNGDVAGMDPALMAEMERLATEMSEDQRLSFAGATFDERRRGTRASYEQSVRDGQRIPSVSADVWRADRIFVHDRLEAGDVPDEVGGIVAAGNLASVGEIGMSFGGSTTGGICMVDPRCGAGVNLDGGDYDFRPFNRNVPAPFLMLYSDLDVLAALVSGDPEASGHGYNDFSYERHETAGLLVRCLSPDGRRCHPSWRLRFRAVHARTLANAALRRHRCPTPSSGFRTTSFAVSSTSIFVGLKTGFRMLNTPGIPTMCSRIAWTTSVSGGLPPTPSTGRYRWCWKPRWATSKSPSTRNAHRCRRRSFSPMWTAGTTTVPASTG